MAMYYQSKFGCKRITSSENTVEAIMFDYVNPHCDLDLDGTEQSIPKTLWPVMVDHHTTFGYKSLHVFRRYPEKPQTKLTSKQEAAVSFRDSAAV